MGYNIKVHTNGLMHIVTSKGGSIHILYLKGALPLCKTILIHVKALHLYKSKVFKVKKKKTPVSVILLYIILHYYY